MIMTATSALPHLAIATRQAEEGPVVLAAKPLGGTDAAVTVARWLSQREERELHVVSVLEGNDALAISAGAVPLPQRYYDEERSAIAARLKEELKASGNEAVRVDVFDGPSAAVIVDTAHDRAARVIVIGTGRHDPLGRFIYGERAMQIVRIADRPVLVVPRGASGGFIRHALVAVDFSAASLRAAAAAAPMLSQGSILTLLHVQAWDAAHEPSSTSVAPMDSRCARRFDRFLNALPLPSGVDIRRRVAWGNPVNAIDEFARTNGVGLIACGRRQNHTIAERLFVGSVSAGLLRRVACPILIVPEDGDGDADTITTLLTGIDHWPREQWPLQVESFGIRNQEHHVRIAVEAEGLRSARCVAQDYRLQTMTYDDHEERLSVFLADTAPTPNVFTLRFADVTSLTLFTDIEGNDMRLTFENANGRGTITVELPKRSSTAEAADA